MSRSCQCVCSGGDDHQYTMVGLGDEVRSIHSHIPIGSMIFTTFLSCQTIQLVIFTLVSFIFTLSLTSLSLASTHSCLRLSSILYLTKRCCSLNMEHYCRLPPPSLPHCYTNKLVLLWTTFLSIPAKFICFIIYLNSLVVTNQYIQLFGYLCILPSLLFLIFLSPLCFSFNIRIQFQ